MKRIYPLMFLVFLAVGSLGVVFAGASASLFLNLPSLVIVLVIAATLSLSTFGPSEIVRYFAIAFRNEGNDQGELREGVVFFRALQWYLIAGGLIGFLIGLITLLAGLQSSTSIGNGTAIALLTVLYGLVLAAGVAVPFRSALERKLRAETGRSGDTFET